MMYEWFIDVTLKGSGAMLCCVYGGPEKVSSEVIEKIFFGKEMNEFVGLGGDDGKSQRWFLIGEVAAIDIRPKRY